MIVKQMQGWLSLRPVLIAVFSLVGWWALPKSPFGTSSSPSAGGEAVAVPPNVGEPEPNDLTPHPSLGPKLGAVSPVTETFLPQLSCTVRGYVRSVAGDPVADATVILGDPKEIPSFRSPEHAFYFHEIPEENRKPFRWGPQSI